MLIPFGVLSAAGAGGVAGDYELIQSYILGSATSSINFASLADYASTYKHLQLRIVARGTNGAAGIVLKMRFNGDTATNYTSHGLQGDGSSVTSFGDPNIDNLLATAMPAAGATANSFSGMVIDILDSYSTTKNKTMRSLSGSTAFNRILLTSGVYLNTASMTSIDLFAAGDNIATGSRFSLYGIKG
jgi:hypothetical protein